MRTELTGAVDIGGTKAAVGIVSPDGRILAEGRFPSAGGGTTGPQAVQKIVELLREQCLALNISLSDLRGIGVSCAGPVDLERGTVENPYTLPGWEGFPLVQRLSEAASLPVRMENDADGALLGEIFLRGLRDKKVLMVTLGTGVGVAFWGNGKLYRSGKYHPEMGHVIVSSEGEDCYCGHRGCFESRCSGKALNDRAAALGCRNFEELLLRAEEGEPMARELKEQIRRDFKNGFWSLNIVFKPQVLILAGGFAQSQFSWLKELILEDSAGKGDFLDGFSVLPAYENKNPALLGANILF